VVIFFVVSGFLVGGAAWRAIRDGVFSCRAYFINRFSRIYLVYVPSLVVCAILTGAGASFLMDTRLYGERPLIPAGVTSDWTVGQIPCHIFAVQGVLCTPWGANPPLWSLGHEWVLYIVAPVMFFIVASRMALVRLVAGLAAAALLVIIAASTGNPETPLWFLFWFLGGAAALICERYNLDWTAGVSSLAVCGGLLVLSRMKFLPTEATDSALALFFAAALCCRMLVSTKFDVPWIRRGAGFSYSLYLTHLPVGIFCGAILEHFGLIPHHLSQPGFASLAAYFGLVVAMLVTADLFARLTEDRTSQVRAFLRDLAGATDGGKGIERPRGFSSLNRQIRQVRD
jgi:peptidoglycan/LPS O-acetylase OafA/YrhL